MRRDESIYRTPPPPVPYAIVAKVEFSIVRTLRVPQARAAELAAYGWETVIRDTDVPLNFTPYPFPVFNAPHFQSGIHDEDGA